MVKRRESNATWNVFFCGQAMYALAASSRQTLVAKGNFVVAEGETGEDSENSLFFVASQLYQSCLGRMLMP